MPRFWLALLSLGIVSVLFLPLGAAESRPNVVLILADGTRHESVVPVRAFPIAAPLQGLSLVCADGKEALWVDHMDHLPAQARTLIASLGSSGRPSR